MRKWPMKTAYDKLLREAGRCESEHDPTALLWFFAELTRWHQSPRGLVNGCWFCRVMKEVLAAAREGGVSVAVLDAEARSEP
jgi:hypothetical protein